MIPDDVQISVLTQARDELIERTVQSLAGAPRATVHMYNATAPVFRRVVFGNDRDETKALAVEGTRSVMKYAESYLAGCDFGYEYSPEIFMDTELDYAAEVCAAVMDVWQPGPGREIILNLPCTVERSTPNVYADQIEWMSRNLPHREHVCVSVHTHNDRGHRGRGRRAGGAGRRGPDRGLPVRQRRADRERLPGHAGPEPVQPGHRPDDRFLRHRRDPAHRRVLQPASGAPPAPVRGRPGLHRVLRLAPGRDQEGPGGAGAGRGGRRHPGPRLPLGGPVPGRSTRRTWDAPTRP